MVSRCLRYNLRKKVAYKDFETHNCLWSFGLYNDHYMDFLLDRRHLYKNVHDIAKFSVLDLSISNKNVPAQNFDALISNFFFLRFFTGKKPYFLPVKVVSTFQEKRYSYVCQVQLRKDEAFFFLAKYISFASNKLSLLDFNLNERSLRKDSLMFYMKSFSYFRIVGTHLVFLDWRAILDIKLKWNRSLSVNEMVDALAVLKVNEALLKACSAVNLLY